MFNLQSIHIARLYEEMKSENSKDAVEVQEALAGIQKEVGAEQFERMKGQAKTMSTEQVIELGNRLSLPNGERAPNFSDLPLMKGIKLKCKNPVCDSSKIGRSRACCPPGGLPPDGRSPIVHPEGRRPTLPPVGRRPTVS